MIPGAAASAGFIVLAIRCNLTLCRELGLCHRSGLHPTLGPFAALGCGADEFDNFGHFESNFFLDDFSQGNICQTEIPRVAQQRPGAGI